ncbi:MAG: cupin domain-containing protein [Prolixibacteraceae bacterium]|jgi:quercetin dioxygenase-like cupin family protein|nr:cupin domain-containing protein [Prolixibacteraceae bacterium]
MKYQINGIIVMVFMMIIGVCNAQNLVKKTDKYVFSTENLTQYKFPTHINDIVMDRSEARFSEVFIVVIEPEKAPPLHKHDDTEQIFYVTEGSGILTIGKEAPQLMKVKPGDVVRVPVGAWHSIKADQGDTLKYLAIDCFGGIRNQDEPTWDSHVRILCKEQGWDYESVVIKK